MTTATKPRKKTNRTERKQRKQRRSRPSDHLESISVIDGEVPIRFTTDTAFDIETAPSVADDDGSLLSPETARVGAIGYYCPITQRCLICYDADEAAMLRQFWTLFLTLNGAGGKLLGFNIFNFDLPFLVKRSWKHGIAVPKNLMTFGGRYFNETFVDLMNAWKCGAWKEFISLDNLAKFLGVGHKVGSGEKFYLLWEQDREAAIEYLKTDVALVIDCAVQMGMTAPQINA